MFKIKYVVVALLLLVATNVRSADQWDKTRLLGTTQVSDIDIETQEQHEALSRLLYDYRSGANVYKVSSSILKVGIGALAIPNLTKTAIMMRYNSSEDTPSLTGALTPSTLYYIHAVADTDIEGWTYTINDSDSHVGTYSRVIGWYYVDSGGGVRHVSNTKDMWAKNSVSTIGTTSISTSSTSYSDMNEMQINFYVSKKSRIRLTFSASIYAGEQNTVDFIFTQNQTTTLKGHRIYGPRNNGEVTVTMVYESITPVDAGDYRFDVRWATSSTAYSYGASGFQRTMTVEEL